MIKFSITCYCHKTILRTTVYSNFFPNMNIYAVGVKKFPFLMNYFYVLKKLVHSLLHEYSIFKFEIYLLFLY